MPRFVNVATPATAVAVVVPVSAAPAVPVPATIATVTTVELSVASVTPLLRTCTTGCVANATEAAAPEGCVATNKVRTGGGVPPLLLLLLPLPPPPPPHAESAASTANSPVRKPDIRLIGTPCRRGNHSRGLEPQTNCFTGGVREASHFQLQFSDVCATFRTRPESSRRAGCFRNIRPLRSLTWPRALVTRFASSR